MRSVIGCLGFVVNVTGRSVVMGIVIHAEARFAVRKQVGLMSNICSTAKGLKADLKIFPETIDTGGGLVYDRTMDTDRMEGNMDTRPEAMNVSKLGMLAGRPKPADLERASIMEIKYDGHRIYMYRDVDRVRTFARSGNEKTGLLRTIEKIVKRLPVGTWIDGESCSFKSDGTNEWGIAQSVLGSDKHRPELEGKITFVVFDMLTYDGKDMRSLPLKNRREILESSFEAAGIFNSDAIMISPQFETSTAAYDALVENGFEGAIVKDPNSTYISGGRGKGWFKMKATEVIEAVVMGTKDGNGKFEGQVGALVFGQYDSAGRLVELGACSGMTDKVRREFTNMRDAGTLNGIVIEVAHMGQMPTGGVRHPQYKRTRTDKDPRTVTIEDQANSL
jgi:bifunctional non-homologous end joining protein LigD